MNIAERIAWILGLPVIFVEQTLEAGDSCIPADAIWVVRETLGQRPVRADLSRAVKWATLGPHESRYLVYLLREEMRVHPIPLWLILLADLSARKAVSQLNAANN